MGKWGEVEWLTTPGQGRAGVSTQGGNLRLCHKTEPIRVAVFAAHFALGC